MGQPVNGLEAVDTDVLVVGAGAVGLTMAVDLARRGVGLRVIDRDPPRSRRESRALGMQARTLEVLERIGVIDEVLAAGRPIDGFAYYVNGHLMLEAGVRGLDAPYPFILLLPQGHLEEILIGRLAGLGVTVERGVEAIGMDQDADAVRVQTRRVGSDLLSSISASYVVACDGGRSTMRHLLGARFDGAAFEGVIHLLDTELDWAGPPPPENRGNFFAGTNTIVGLGRLDGSVWRVIGYLRPDDPRAAGELTAAGMQSILDEHPYLGARVHNVEWQSVYRVSNRMVNRLRFGRVFLAGDAAHIHSPMGGQGLNTGVQDAHNLAWKLGARLHENAADSLLDSYQVERLPVIASVLNETANGHRLLSDYGRSLARPWAAMVGKVLAPPLNAMINRTRMREIVARSLGQLAVNYRDSPIVEGGERVGPLRAGDRAPDASTVTATGVQTRIHRVFADDTAHHLLAFAGLDATDAEIVGLGERLAELRAAHPGLVAHRVLRRGPGYRAVRPHPDDVCDLDGSVHDRYDSDTAQYQVIRPDGYLAARLNHVSATTLSACVVRCGGAVPLLAPQSS